MEETAPPAKEDGFPVAQDKTEFSADLGLLDLTVRLSTREVTAGKQFAVFVLVKNPFRQPVWIERVDVSLPSELFLAHDKDEIAEMAAYDEKEKLAEKEKVEQQRQLLEKVDALKKSIDSLIIAKNNGENSTSYIEGQLRDLIEDLKDTRSRGPQLSFDNLKDIGDLRVVSANPRLSVIGTKGGFNIGTLEVVDPETVIKPRMSRQRIVHLKSSLPPGAPLYPSSTAVYTVRLDVRRSFIFPPSNYHLQFNANFSFDPVTSGDVSKYGRLQTNTTAFEINIRPSIFSLIGGAMIGGVVGSVSRLLRATTGLSDAPVDWNMVGTNLLSVGLAAILSAIAIIFVARKSDAQSFISVEDFWGGLLTGFFVGYTGTEFFGQLTHNVGQSPPVQKP